MGVERVGGLGGAGGPTISCYATVSFNFESCILQMLPDNLQFAGRWADADEALR